MELIESALLERKAKLFATSFIFLATISYSSDLVAARFYAIPTLGPYGSQSINDISADGSIVVGSDNDRDKVEAFMWTREGGTVGLGFLSPVNTVNTASTANGISADGTIIVGHSNVPSGSKAFRWTKDEGMIELAHNSGNVVPKTAFAVSADGSVIVGIGDPPDTASEAFRWDSDGNVVGLGKLRPTSVGTSNATDVSDDGSVIVGSAVSWQGRDAFIWTESEGMVGLGDIPGGNHSSTANAVSADGQVVVGQGSPLGDIEAFRWTKEEGMVGLGTLPGAHRSIAYDTNGDGTIVVGRSDSFDDYTQPFIWDVNNGMRNLNDVLSAEYDLDVGDWILGTAYAISDDGLTIAGRGLNPSGLSAAWVIDLHPIPEPTTCTLALLGLCLNIGRCAKVRRRAIPTPETDVL